MEHIAEKSQLSSKVSQYDSSHTKMLIEDLEREKEAASFLAEDYRQECERLQEIVQVGHYSFSSDSFILRKRRIEFLSWKWLFHDVNHSAWVTP
jgi:hypothetical protein